MKKALGHFLRVLRFCQRQSPLLPRYRGWRVARLRASTGPRPPSSRGISPALKLWALFSSFASAPLMPLILSSEVEIYCGAWQADAVRHNDATCIPEDKHEQGMKAATLFMQCWALLKKIRSGCFLFDFTKRLLTSNITKVGTFRIGHKLGGPSEKQVCKIPIRFKSQLQGAWPSCRSVSCSCT